MSFIKKLLPLLCCVFTAQAKHTFTIMLDPAGDAQHTGRRLDDSFERGVTLQFAEQLKSSLESRYKNIRVVLTRFPGETLQPLQNANFANRLDVDFYVTINFFYATHIKPQVFMYCFAGNTPFSSNATDLAFYPYDKAHVQNSATTHNWGNSMFTHLHSNRYTKLFDLHPFTALPFKPLVGIKAPAIAFEMSLKNKHDWHMYLAPLTESFENIITLNTQHKNSL